MSTPEIDQKLQQELDRRLDEFHAMNAEVQGLYLSERLSEAQEQKLIRAEAGLLNAYQAAAAHVDKGGGCTILIDQVRDSWLEYLDVLHSMLGIERDAASLLTDPASKGDIQHIKGMLNEQGPLSVENVEQEREGVAQDAPPTSSFIDRNTANKWFFRKKYQTAK